MKKPNFSYENKLWKDGFKFVAGVDEVGRGCFAGPVVAGCVCFDNTIKVPKEIYVNDSKKVSAKKRIIADIWIRENALSWGIGESSVAEINRLGMGKATKVAFRRAVSKTNQRFHKKIEYLLIDAFYIPHTKGFPIRRKSARNNHELKDTKARQLAIVNGDEKSLSIAAGSIIAKVYRDNLMEKMGSKKKYKKYGWALNKGYATEIHRNAIIKFGKTYYHRKKFIETFEKNLASKS